MASGQLRRRASGPGQRLSTLLVSSLNVGARAKCLLRQRVPCQDYTFSYSNLHDKVNCIIEISEVEVQLPKWWVTLRLYVSQYVQVWGSGRTSDRLTQY